MRRFIKKIYFNKNEYPFKYFYKNGEILWGTVDSKALLDDELGYSLYDKSDNPAYKPIVFEKEEGKKVIKDHDYYVADVVETEDKFLLTNVHKQTKLRSYRMLGKKDEVVYPQIEVYYDHYLENELALNPKSIYEPRESGVHNIRTYEIPFISEKLAKMIELAKKNSIDLLLLEAAKNSKKTFTDLQFGNPEPVGIFSITSDGGILSTSFSSIGKTDGKIVIEKENDCRFGANYFKFYLSSNTKERVKILDKRLMAVSEVEKYINPFGHFGNLIQEGKVVEDSEYIPAYFKVESYGKIFEIYCAIWKYYDTDSYSNGAEHKILDVLNEGKSIFDWDFSNAIEVRLHKEELPDYLKPGVFDCREFDELAQVHNTKGWTINRPGLVRNHISREEVAFVKKVIKGGGKVIFKKD